MVKQTLLYITFVDLKEGPKSGSGIRPLRMLEAFQQMDLEIKVLEGMNNNGPARRQGAQEIFSYLQDHRPDFCYIEPPAGPIFHGIDRKLMKKIHALGIPLGLFYRDAYWMFPERMRTPGLGLVGSWKQAIKNQIIIALCKRDLAFYRKTMDVFFVPSRSFAELVDLKGAIPLPPGGEAPLEGPKYAQEVRRLEENPILNFFYVGSITGEYGGDLLLESFADLNRERVKHKLLLVCPKAQWEEGGFAARYDRYRDSWLEVYHVSAGSGLEEVYDRADVCLLAQRITPYNNVAVNVKLFEYLSKAKPILATASTEVAKILQSTQAGRLTQDNSKDFVQAIESLAQDRPDLVRKKARALAAAKENTWLDRAQRVVEALEKKAYPKKAYPKKE